VILLRAGLDGNVQATIRSVDDGANWTEIYNGEGASAIGIYCGNGFRLFGTEDGIGNHNILRTINDTVFTNVLTTGHCVTSILDVNGILYAVGATYHKNKYPAILTSEDNGITWKTARTYSFRNTANFQGHYLGFSNIGNIGGEDIAILSNENSLPAAKLYGGGAHYEALFYVCIPILPTTGFKMKCYVGGASSDINNTFIIPNISNLLLHYKLDEGIGSVINDSSVYGKNGVLTIGTGYWNTTDIKRIAAFTPAVRKTGKSLYLNGDGYILITGSDVDADLQITDNFSVVMWGKSLMTVSQSFMGNQSGNYGWGFCGVGAANVLTLNVGNGSSINQYYSSNYFLIDEISMVGFIIESGTVKFILNGSVEAAQSITNPISLNSKPIYIGDKSYYDKFKGDIDDVRIYGKPLSDIEVRCLYEDTNIIT
jgi:hypothetical protein